MNCESCGEKRKGPEPVSFLAHESGMARMERANRRQWLIIVLLVCVIAVCVGLIVHTNNKRIDAINEKIEAINELRELERSIETVYEYEVEQETGGNGSNYVVGGDFYGEAEGKS